MVACGDAREPAEAVFEDAPENLSDVQDETEPTLDDTLSGDSEDVKESTAVLFENQPDGIRVIMDAETIILSNSSKSISGIKIGETFQYNADFVDDYNNVAVRCESTTEISEVITLACVVDGEYGCTAVLVKNEDGSFALDENNGDCSLVINSLLVPPPQEPTTPLVPLDGAGNSATKFLSVGKAPIWGHDPELCPKVTEHPVNGSENMYDIDYALNDSEILPVMPFNYIKSDGQNVLEVTMVYSATNKEGCFNYIVGEICNQPWGNFHIKTTPDSMAGLNAPDDYTKDYIIGMTSTHLLLQGPYQSDTDQCEWYDESVVGPQLVFYKNKYIWDWDTFFAFKSYQGLNYEPVYTSTVKIKIWESDEGFQNDDIMEITLKKKDTLGKEASFGDDNFLIKFRTVSIK